jgi:hypothetical protein
LARTASETLNVAVEPEKVVVAKVIPPFDKTKDVMSVEGLPDSATVMLVTVKLPVLELLNRVSFTVTPEEPLKIEIEAGGAPGP